MLIESPTLPGQNVAAVANNVIHNDNDGETWTSKVNIDSESGPSEKDMRTDGCTLIDSDGCTDLCNKGTGTSMANTSGGFDQDYEIQDGCHNDSKL